MNDKFLSYIKSKELSLGPNELIEVLKPLYGLSESGDYWCETFTKFHLHDLRMKQSTSDFSLFFRRVADKLVSLSGFYVDDLLQAAPAHMKDKLTKKN